MRREEARQTSVILDASVVPKDRLIVIRLRLFRGRLRRRMCAFIVIFRHHNIGPLHTLTNAPMAPEKQVGASAGVGLPYAETRRWKGLIVVTLRNSATCCDNFISLSLGAARRLMSAFAAKRLSLIHI